MIEQDDLCIQAVNLHIQCFSSCSLSRVVAAIFILLLIVIHYSCNILYEDKCQLVTILFLAANQPLKLYNFFCCRDSTPLHVAV